MNYPFARMSCLVLAFGLLIGCSTLQDLTGGSESSTAEPRRDDPARELADLNRMIENGEADALTFYRKGELLQERARNLSEPAPRQPLYRQMRQALLEARRRPDDGEDGQTAEHSDELLKVAWSNEHNSGLQYSGADSSRGTADPERAVAHFRNAITIIPDSLSSYRLKAQTHYRNDQPSEAIATLEEARGRITPLPADLMEQLAFLHFEQENYNEAIAVYRDAGAADSGSRNMIHGLANAYIQAGRHDEAIPLLQELADSRPGNLSYALSLGTELWFAGRARIEGVGEPPLEEADYRAADSLFRRAEGLYNNLLEERPEDDNLHRQFAHLCQNVSLLYRDHAGLPGAPREMLQGWITRYLKASLPHLVFLAEREEEGEDEYTRRLISVYTWLGMEEQARELRGDDNSNR
ncbi:MAG: tetratricopeptide repeat protein [Balneolaceae bacterium]|nr:tetratricopeptide repeat protein [Balneolaceae bacterium]